MPHNIAGNPYALSKWLFRGFSLTQANVFVHDMPGFSLPPLRGSNFTTQGATGTLWQPKIHDERHIAIELYILDNPQGAASYYMDQLAALAANRTQGPLVLTLPDGSTRTGQAEITAFPVQKVDAVGSVWSVLVDFTLADPWLYGPTVSATTAITNTPTFGPAAQVAMSTTPGGIASYTLALAGVTSGQPIMLFHVLSPWGRGLR